MSMIQGRRVAIAGMGRSGLALAKACLRFGGTPTVYDEKPGDEPPIIRAVDELQAMGASAVPGWHGRLDPGDHEVLVASPGFRREHPAIRDMVAGNREVISEVEFAYRIAKAPIVAITGTNGKSTTTVMTWLMFTASGKSAVLCGNIAGSGYDEQTLTEAALDATENDVLVAEVSSYQLEWVREFQPRVATITNVTPDHFDRHPSFEDYYQTKLRLFSQMSTGDIIVANSMESSLPVDELRTKVASDVTFRVFNASDSPTRAIGDGQWFGGIQVDRAEFPLLGEHQWTNAMCAFELASAMHPAKPEAMIGALRIFRGLNHRMQFLGEKGGIRVVNNSMCTNPAAVVSSSLAIGVHQHLLMGGLTKGLPYADVRRHVETRGHRVYLYGQDTDILQRQIGPKATVYESLEDAFAAAIHEARPGEVVMLSPGCASAWPYRDFRERGDAFVQIAMEWLR